MKIGSAVLRDCTIEKHLGTISFLYLLINDMFCGTGTVGVGVMIGDVTRAYMTSSAVMPAV